MPRIRSAGPRLSLAAGLLAALVSVSAPAMDSSGMFAVKGPGATTCQSFLDTLQAGSEARYAYGGWLEGFLTAANLYLDQTYDLAAWESSPTLAALLANHCRNNPNLSFLNATRQMVVALQPDRIEKQSELVEVDNDGEVLRLYRETVARVQTRLAEIGLFEGEADGDLGEPTRAAIKAFQEQSSLQATGLPDQATLMSLMRAPTE